MSRTPILVWTLPSPWPELPSPSPFVAKLLTWMRMVELPYELRVLKGPPRSTTGKVPYIERPDGTLLADSSVIVETLAREHGCDLDAELDAHQRAIARTVQRTLEEHTYFTVLWDRWVRDESWRVTGPAYFPSFPVNLLRPIIRRQAIGAARGQGMARHRPERVAELLNQDLEAIDVLLGDDEQLLGRLSTIDATMFAFLQGMLRAPLPGSPTREKVAARPRLVAYVDRMQARYWPDLPTGPTPALPG